MQMVSPSMTYPCTNYLALITLPSKARMATCSQPSLILSLFFENSIYFTYKSNIKSLLYVYINNEYLQNVYQLKALLRYQLAFFLELCVMKICHLGNSVHSGNSLLSLQRPIVAKAGWLPLCQSSRRFPQTPPHSGRLCKVNSFLLPTCS